MSNPKRRSTPTLTLLVAVMAAGFFSTPAHAGKAAKVTATSSGSNAKPAQPDIKADCEFVEISATTSPTPKIDSELASIEKKLKKPPFSSWNTFKQLTRVARPLLQLKSESVKLSTGSVSVLLREVTGLGGKRPRLALSVTMDDADGKRVMDTKVNVDAGEFFLIGRSLANNAGHVLALSCRM
ncbi:MAG: hypothetical protein KBG15_07195 [Kofleriaceae bacterium]|nr:hypothetical protein [Kofleriaceae bacterium]